MNSHKLAVVIPYRDRLEHLKILLPELKKCLHGIPNEIILVEQEQGTEFNRGCLKNIGFTYAADNCDYVCFHDVDMIPDTATYDYYYSEGAVHLATKTGQFGFKMPYDKYFGGVLLLTKEAFTKINGYGNKFVGWGAEDDDLYNRCKHYGIPITSRDCVYTSLPHERKDRDNVSINSNYCKACLKNPAAYSYDGLNSLEYKILNVSESTFSDVKLIHLLVSIKKYSAVKQFTYDWFSGNIPTFKKFLNEFKDKQNLSFLEIGCFEGKCTCWLLENILTHESSKITVIDPFIKEMFLDKKDIGNYYSRFQNNIEMHKNKVKICVGMSWDLLGGGGELKDEKYDFIYIDAGHKAIEVALDAQLSFPKLNHGGILIFDDYLWGDYKTQPESTPKIAIDAFIASQNDCITVLHSGYQVVIRKN